MLETKAKPAHNDFGTDRQLIDSISEAHDLCLRRIGRETGQENEIRFLTILTMQCK